MGYWEPEGYYKLGEGEYNGISAADVLDRMREVAQVSTLSELASCLGVRLALLTDTKRRNIMPVRWVQLLSKSCSSHSFQGASWILTGRSRL